MADAPGFNPSLIMIDNQTWFVLLLPNAMLITVALIRRTWTWQHAVAYSVGNLVVSAIIGYWDVYVLRQMDEKFRRAPDVALEISLMGSGMLSAFGGALLIGSLSLWKRLMRRTCIPSKLLPLSVLAGAVDAVGLRLLYTILRQSGAYAPIAWAWMCCFPLIYSAVAIKYGSSGPHNDTANLPPAFDGSR